MAFIIVVSIYSALIIILAFGFARLFDFPEQKTMHLHSISIVVASRNEGPNINKLLASLSHIIYPFAKWELILVDDHSADGSIDSLDVSAYPFRIRKVSAGDSTGKKAAITTGIAASISDIIVTTDADCTVMPRWLEKINIAFMDTGKKMLIGGVRIEEGSSLFSRMQSMEFVSVAAMGAATLALGFPTMCNGANLSYRRDAFNAVDGYQGNENISSGDDESLMNKFHQRWKGCIGYLYSSYTLATTSPRPNVTSFIDQRLRWAGKWNANTSPETRAVAVVVLLIHLSFVLMIVSTIFGIISWKLFAILAGAKIFVEALFLVPAARFYRVKWSWISFAALQFVYSLYVIYVGFMSQILSQRWKGRAVETRSRQDFL
jgi:biofilm PGA synthesis N-glycosyltransferase PgaC